MKKYLFKIKVRINENVIAKIEEKSIKNVLSYMYSLNIWFCWEPNTLNNNSSLNLSWAELTSILQINIMPKTNAGNETAVTEESIKSVTDWIVFITSPVGIKNKLGNFLVRSVCICGNFSLSIFVYPKYDLGASCKTSGENTK